jgi:hypothetical protein
VQFSLLLVGCGAVVAACSGDETADNGGGSANATQVGNAGKSGSAGKGGAAGTAGKGGAAGKAGGTGGSAASGGGTPLMGGNAGSGNGSGNGNSGTGGKSTAGSSGTSGAGGGMIPPDAADACSNDTDPPKIVRTCRPPTDNECDGKDYPGFKPEGATGNGFDDDCDGLVDEGCPCTAGGTTKDCFLLPSSQTSGKPDYTVVGWCAKNSKGKEECKVGGSAEFPVLQYTGQCIGAQPPFVDDFCAAGDFNCDGVEANAPGGCKCKPNDPVVCPDPIYTQPFPNPNEIGQFGTAPHIAPTISGIDGHTWIDPKVLDPTKTTNWRWTLVGGPCDDILPHPTYAVFPTKVGTPGVDWSAHLGVETLKLPITPDADSPDPAFSKDMAKLIHQGWIIAGATAPSKIFPAFSLSGDYYVTGKFTYPDPANPATTKEGQCTQVVKVRAPGLRVELCWPEVGPSMGDNDVDLHLSRLQGNPAGDNKHGWFTTAGTAPNADDCYYSPNSACGNRTNSGPGAQTTPGWFADEVTDEPGGVGICHGWGSRRFDGSTTGTMPRPCTSPRLDRDNIACNPSVEDPNYPEKDPGQQGEVTDNFCGPENINLDGKVLKAGDRFGIGVQCYNCVSGNNGDPSAKPAHPRVNVYCDGELKLGFGYDPSKPTGAEQYPALWTEGQTYNGSLWTVAEVTWNGSGDNPCTITPLNAGAEWKKDDWHQKSNGSEFLCVNNGALDKDAGNYSPATPSTINWPFQADGKFPPAPATSDQLCSY